MTAVPYRIRRSDRARRARISVSAEGVEVVVPRRLPLREVEPFVEQKRAWIERTLRRIREAEAECPGPLLEDGGQVPYLGERLVLRVAVEPGRSRARVVRRGGELRVVLGVGEPDAPAVAAHDALAPVIALGEPDALRAALERWYRRRAHEEVGARLDRATARAGVPYRSLQIRGQRTRWASCSEQGAMSFNWRLLLAPAEVLDYVVEHEIAHLEVHDHSERFWSLLASRCPDYAEREAWLRRHGQSLRL